MSVATLAIKELTIPEQHSNLSARRLTWRQAGSRQIDSRQTDSRQTDREATGSKAALVLLHGISSGSLSWLKQLTDPMLTDRYRLLAWDAPGYGNSDDLVTEQPTAATYAEVLHQLIEEQQLEQPILLGHSLGAIIASAYAARYPQRLSGLILANPAQGYASTSAEKRQQVFEQRQTLINTLGAEGYAEQRAAALLQPNALAEDIAWVKQNMSRLRLAGFRRSSWMLANDDIDSYLSHYRGPTEVWCGAQDTITPPAAAQTLAQRNGAKFKLIEQAGHASYLDAPEVFNQYLNQFARQYYCTTAGEPSR